MKYLESTYTVSRRVIFNFFLFLSCFELLVYLGTDLISPAMLTVVSDMHVPSHHVATAFNAYLLGGIAFQWLIGPLSDRYGRRPLLISGSLIFSLAFLAGAFSRQIELFNLLRFLQGTAIGFVMVVIYPMLQEFFEEEDAVRLMALLSNIALISPLVGPLLGSFLLKWFTWRFIFAGIGIISLITLAGFVRWIPETLGVSRKDGEVIKPIPLSLSATCHSYWRLWRECRFISGSIALGLISIPLVSWVGMSPLLVMETLKHGQLAYALLQLPVFSGVIVGTLLLNKLASRYSLRKLLHLSLLPLAAGAAGLVLSSCFTLTLLLVVIFLVLYATGLGLGSAILYRLTLFTVSDGYGCVAAMLGMLSTAVVSASITLLTLYDAAADLSRFASSIALMASLAIIPLWFFLKTAPPEEETQPTTLPKS